MSSQLQGLHDLVHLLLNVVSVLNTLLLAVDALFGAQQARRRADEVSAANSAARR